MDELPPIATLSEPQSDNDSTHAGTSGGAQVSPLANSIPSGGQVAATQLGSFNFIIPSRLSPLPPAPLRKRRKSSLSSARVTKAQKTSTRASAVGLLSTSQIPELERLDELPEPSQIFSTPPVSLKSKGKQPLRLSQPVAPMSSRGVGRLSSFFNNPKVANQPRKSAPAKLEYETIELDSSDDEMAEPVLTTSQPPSSQPPPTPRDPDVINISDSDSDAEPTIPPPRARPSLTAPGIPNKNTPPLSQKSLPRALPVSSASILTESLPPLPPSSDVEQSPVEASSLPSGSTPLRAHRAPLDKSTHRSPHDTGPRSSSDSGSSGGVVETDVVPTGLDEPSFVLNSGGSSSSHNSSPSPGDPTEEPQEGRGRSTTLASPRGRPPARSSPSHGSMSGAASEAELEEIVASVSLHDPQSNLQTDKAIAQTTTAVSNIALTDESEREQGSLTDTHSAASGSISNEGTIGYKCSIEGCGSKFTAPSQLHTHMRRDHGVRLSQDTRRVRHGKRKADDTPMTPTKRQTHTSRSGAQTSQTFASGSGSDRSGRSSQSSNHYVERTNTIGFEPFAQNLSERGSLSPPESDDDMDEPIVISDSSPSSPRTPAPPVPKMRAPHPNVRPSVPDSPSTHLSPSKQLAQKKNEVIIPGEELETWRVDIVNSMPESYRNSPGIRVVFEAFMDEAMRENEPCAPAIPVENRVWQQGRKHKVVLRKTNGKGWGVFAGEHIPAGAYLGVYTGELLTEGFASKRA
ncbi:hypothetical protein FRC06_006590, partial [Ceratobasidium sp. 370]